MAWAKAGTTTLGSAGDNIDATSLTDNKFLMYMIHPLATGNITDKLRINGDSGSNYSYRQSNDGAADGTATSQDFAGFLGFTVNPNESFSVGYIINISTEEKLIINHSTDNDAGTGAGTAPHRRESVLKFANTSDAVDEVNVFNDSTGDFDTDSNLTVIGSDGTESLNVQDGAIYYDTTLNKEYVLYNNTWTEL